MKKFLFLALVAISLASSPVSSKSLICANPSEKQALNTRVVVSSLMVAALTCGQRDNYGSVVKKFQSQITESGSKLKDFFSRVYKGKSQFEMDHFVTKLANQESKRGVGSGFASYCHDSFELFNEVLGLTPAQFSELTASDRFSAAHGIEGCQKSL